MLINLSNHPSANWPEKQKKVALTTFGKVIDMPFPHVSPEADAEEIGRLAGSLVPEIMDMISRHKNAGNAAIHIMGEMTLAFSVIARFKELGLSCVASTTRRVAKQDGDQKTSTFEFVQFREY